ncbi:MAG: transcription initiation factor IIB family protein, partial [Halobacteriales archaeon]|nr:transcription initiation factor IIB family protein [Halobacteriales archaeon]
EAARATEGELKAAYDAMNRRLGLPTGPIDPREYLPRFASELDLPSSIERAAREFVGRATDLGLTNGRTPCGVAAACLYAAATERDYPLTQSDAAAVAGVTPVTVRSSFTALSS